eukprot:5424614-Pyramimonas_sp.AAC.1
MYWADPLHPRWAGPCGRLWCTSGCRFAARARSCHVEHCSDFLSCPSGAHGSSSLCGRCRG